MDVSESGVWRGHTLSFIQAMARGFRPHPRACTRVCSPLSSCSHLPCLYFSDRTLSGSVEGLGVIHLETASFLRQFVKCTVALKWA